jgi:hypothetical protein
MLYRWHFGNIRYAIKREIENDKNINTLYKKALNANYFENTIYADSLPEIQKKKLEQDVHSACNLSG